MVIPVINKSRYDKSALSSTEVLTFYLNYGWKFGPLTREGSNSSENVMGPCTININRRRDTKSDQRKGHR